jgi:hypothetical protein
MKIADLFHSLLKAIHEWIAGDGAVPTYVPLLPSSGAASEISEGDIRSPSGVQRSRQRTTVAVVEDGVAHIRWCNFAFSVAAAIYS